MSFDVVRFGDLFSEPQRNGLTRPKKVRGSGLPMVNMGELFAYPRIRNIAMDLVPIEDKEHHYLLESGDLLFARQSLVLSGAGQCSIFLGNFAPTVFESHLIRCRLNPQQSNPLFYFYFFRSHDGRRAIETIVEQGAGASGIRGSDLVNVQVPNPPKQIQDEVAGLLGSLDDRITLLRETNATLEAIAQAVFKSWFVDFDPVRAKMEGRAPEGMDEATAGLFPDSLEETELGAVPKGWSTATFSEFIQRLSVGKKFDQKTALTEGAVPILDQGKSGIIGFHNEEPGVIASIQKPVVVFANHTCYMRLITYDFSAIQNVLPFVGKEVDTVWAYFATKGRVQFSEYKGHWPDFSIQKAILPPVILTKIFRNTIESIIYRLRINELQSEYLSSLRDELLPRLISGKIIL